MQPDCVVWAAHRAPLVGQRTAWAMRVVRTSVFRRDHEACCDGRAGPLGSARWLCRRLSEPWPLTIWLQVCERTRDKGEELSQGQERVFDLITSGAVGEVDDYVHAQTGRKNTHNARGDDGGSGGSGAGEEGQAGARVVFASWGEAVFSWV